MFKIDLSDDYSWPVAVSLPMEGGKTEKATFDARFKRISQTRVREIRDSIQASTITDQAIADEVLVGWDGIQSDGDPVRYSESAKAQLLDIPGVAYALVMAFLESLAGAKRKN